MPDAPAPITFWKFFQIFVRQQRISLPLKPFHQEVCSTLALAVAGELPFPYVVINIAPRVGKSKILEALACWSLGIAPDAQTIYTSFSEELVTDRVRYICEVMRTEWYQDLFPETRLGDVQQAGHFTTTLGGRVYGAGTGGTISGKGGGLKRRFGGFIAIDDPANPNEALSRTEAENLKFWFENVLKSRRNSDRWCPIILVMQRLSTDDLTGYILENYPEETRLLKFASRDRDGQSIIPETISTAGLNQWEKVNPFTFWAQQMQEPVVFGGNLIKVDDFILEPLDPFAKWDRKIITADTAFKTKEHNDQTVFELWGKRGQGAYLLDCLHGKWESPQLLGMALAFYRKHRAGLSQFYVEDKASGTGLVQQLKAGGVPVSPVERIHDKVTRVQEILPYIATHRIHINKDQPWTRPFLEECAAFRADGLQKHDDFCDPLADACMKLLGKRLSVWDVLGSSKNRHSGAVIQKMVNPAVELVSAADRAI
jgi:predicted phage terminase large subunit-like protein